MIDRLVEGDETALETFLAARAESSMFLRSNARRAGLVDRGEPFQATYMAVRDQGEILGVVAHAWNGMLLLQAPEPLCGPLAQAAASRSGRPIKGFAGPWAQVKAARAGVGMEGAPAIVDSREDLFALDLAKLVLPRALEDGRVVCRPPREDELELCAAWRYAYHQEAFHAPPSDALRAQSADEIEGIFRRKACWVLEADGSLVAYTGFNAELPDCVQVGGVYTPPNSRSRGFARAVVAGSLVAARERGAERAVLFTGSDNGPARAAYEAIGFRLVGDYGLILLAG